MPPARRGWIRWRKSAFALLLVLGVAAPLWTQEIPSGQGTVLPLPTSAKVDPPVADPVLVGEEPGASSVAPQPIPNDAPPLFPDSSGGQMPPTDAASSEPKGWWTRVPNVQAMPPLGHTVLTPKGPGYYTFLDVLQDKYRETPPKYPYPRFGIYPGSFINADWRYLDNAEAVDRDYLDFLKRIRLGDDFMFTTGGEFRYRYNNESDSRLSGKNNVYDLTRTRVYGDFWYRDIFRIYGELINAQSFNQDLPPLPVDQYNVNFLNLFVDLKTATLFDRPMYLRGGRQELLYGSQRLISPLDWVNTRRTFQGGKLFWQSDKFSLDGFVVQPVIPSANSFASVNWQQIFSGIWGTYRPTKGESLDLYYLDFQDSNQIYIGQYGAKGTENVSTGGTRWYGNKNDWLWDMEGMLQFGRYSNQGILANAYTLGGGYNFSKLPMNPTLWMYYDYASGDPNPGGTVHRTFNQLFPFGHYYFGMMDIVGRQNINDFHAELSIFPVKWWTIWTQYHILRLDSPKDFLYNSAGLPTLRDPTGTAGINVGEILTVINNFSIDLHQSVFVQYSHLYAGNFLRQVGNGKSPDYLYLMYSYRW